MEKVNPMLTMANLSNSELFSSIDNTEAQQLQGGGGAAKSYFFGRIPTLFLATLYFQQAIVPITNVELNLWSVI
jgi:hypothetical protein